jgi:hypothetical protein
MAKGHPRRDKIYLRPLFHPDRYPRCRQRPTEAIPRHKNDSASPHLEELPLTGAGWPYKGGSQYAGCYRLFVARRREVQVNEFLVNHSIVISRVHEVTKRDVMNTPEESVA